MIWMSKETYLLQKTPVCPESFKNETLGNILFRDILCKLAICS